jgi:dihydroorotate dehydrogenase (fumarate)
MADLRVNLCGIELSNPLIVSSGPLSYAAQGIRRCFAAGAAAAVTKTISLQPARNPTPHIVGIGRGSMLNTEKWADLSAEQWTEVEFPALAGAGGVVIASMGHTLEAVQEIAPRVARCAAVRLIEVVSYRAEDMAPMVAAAKRLTSLPVLAKLGPNWPDLYETVEACVAAGVDGVTAADSVGPTLAIDIETGRPALGGDYGYAWMSGAAIRPIIVRIVADIRRRHPTLPIVATGGVTEARDVVEMLMVGATAVGAHTAPMLKGVGWFKKTADALTHWLDAHGYASPAEVRDKALPWLIKGEDTTPLEFLYRPEDCTECGRCVLVCAYEARRLTDKQMELDRRACRSCGLCVAECPTGALSLARR